MDKDLEYVIRHVFLPPKLPERDDSASRNDLLLTQFVKDALISSAARTSYNQCRSLSSMLDVMLDEDNGVLSTAKLDYGLKNMQENDATALHIRNQNAGIIIRRSRQAYSFESFELSPVTDAVTAAKGRLRCVFPGPAIAVAVDRVQDPTFREAFIELISQLDSQVLEEACPTTKKAKNEVVEIRQTIHPKYVTEMLMGILRAIGRPHEVERIEKRTRDEVVLKYWRSMYFTSNTAQSDLFYYNPDIMLEQDMVVLNPSLLGRDALLPWRRSPRWLLIRVALQTTLATKQGNDQVHTQYKFFMLFLMAQILERALISSLPSDILFIMTAKISRRMVKLGDLADDMPWLRPVQNAVESTKQKLMERWDTLQQNPDPLGCSPATDLGELRSDTDTCLSLKAMREYYNELQGRNLQSAEPTKSIPQSVERIKQDGFCNSFTEDSKER